MKETGVRKQEVAHTARRAVFIPLFIFLLAMFPPVKHTFAWIDIRFSDTLFSITPFLRQLTGKPPLEKHPVVVITKDQTFFNRFNRDANRHDFALLTEYLSQKGVRVMAYDFIFSHPSDEPTDRFFAEKLASFSLPIMATHFVGRGKNTFEKADITDYNAHRPPWPEKVFHSFANAAADTALINVAADYDSVIRYAPLAFHPTEMSEFMPSLGYSTWIASLVNNYSQQIVSKCVSLKGFEPADILSRLLADGPEKYSSTGHEDLDKATRRLELKFLARFAASVFPELSQKLKSAAEEFEQKNFTDRSWLKMPQNKLPIIGSYHIPCVRLPFNRPNPPFRGDGIKSYSMGTLLETEADRSSTHTAFKFQLKLSESRENLSFSVLPPIAESGKSSVKGRAVDTAGIPVKNASVLILMPDSGYWEKTSTNENGEFELSNLLHGDFLLTLTNRSENGWLKATMRGNLAPDSTIISPLLLLPSLTETLKIENLKSSDKTDLICVFGEALPMIRSDLNGKTKISELPQGYSVVSLEEEDEIRFAKGALFNKDQTIVPEKIAALISDDSSWNLQFMFKFPVGSAILKGLPCSLDSRIAVLSETLKDAGQNTEDFTLLPEKENTLEKLPLPSHDTFSKVKVFFDSESERQISIFLADESGRIINAETGKNLELEAGRYFVLTEKSGRRGIFAPAEFRESVVFFGSALPQDQDFIITPINFLNKGDGQLPGVNLHANLFSCLSRQTFIKSLPTHSDTLPFWWPLAQTMIILPLLAILNLLFVKYGAVWGVTGVIATAILWLSSGIVLFINNFLLPFFFPLLQLLSFGFFRGYISWSIARKQELETRQTFGRFISPAVVDDILKTPDSLRPGGEKKELTVIFTDLAGFTSISEKLEPEQLTELMNEYLDEMTRILFRFGGTLDKYIGDAIMGFWNHPKAQPDHATRSVECAIQMQKKLAELREKWLKQGLPRVEVRAGINSAVCMVGFIGSEIQMNFTCLGDGVNLASRLEGANKAYNTFIMIADSVHQQIDHNIFSTRFLDFLAVKGKEKPILVFEVRGYRKDEPSEWLEAEENYKHGIERYLARDWENAIKAFNSVLTFFPDDGPAKIYIERCHEFRNSPPPPDWDGRYILKTK